MQLYLWLNALAFIVAMSSNSLTVSRQETVLDSEEYAVYSVILNQSYIGRKLAVIRDRTFVDNIDGYGARVARRIEELLSPAVETVDDYKEKSAKSYKLERRFDLRVPYILITAKQDRVIFKSGVQGWRSFYEKYPDSSGELEVSRVGFNRRRDQALVYVAQMRGGLCGSGTYVLLVKIDDDWIVFDKLQILYS